MHRVALDLYSGDVPYVYICTGGTTLFVPFKHTLEIFWKSPGFDVWTVDDDDYEGFDADMRTVREWECFLLCDRGYQHGTAISCCHETIHGDRLRVRSEKNMKGHRPYLEMDVELAPEEGPHIQADLVQMADAFPESERTRNMRVRAPGRVCVYTMDGMRYSHERHHLRTCIV